MKKKIVSVVLALSVVLMCVLFAGCDESTFGVINKALEKTQSMDSMDAQMSLEMNMAAQGVTISIPMTADIKANGLRSDSPVMSSVISMSMMGQEMEIEMYQEGEWAYMISSGTKYKMNVADTEDEYDYTDNVNNMLQDIPEELLKDVELEKGDNGSVTATISIPDEEFADIYDDFIDDVNENTGIDDAEIKISDAVVKITVADGYVSAYDMEFTMELVVEEVTATTDVKASVTYKNPGEKVKVTPPEDYKNFEELNIPDIAE